MKLSQTTLAGSFAAGTLAASECPGLPHGIQVALVIAAAACLGWLGHQSKDCPIDCPGTDDLGRPNRLPRTPIFPALLAILAAMIALVTLLTGCATANPKAGPQAPGQPAYVVNPALYTASNTIVPLIGAAGAATGAGGLIEQGAAALFGILGAISVLVARKKSAVATALANGVATAGPEAVRATLTSAADTSHFAAVATLLNDATPTGQAPGGPTPCAAAK